MVRFLIIFVLIISVYGCSDSNNNSELGEEYALVHSLNISNSEAELLFVKKLIEEFTKIEENNDAKIDIEELSNLMDDAKLLNSSRIKLLLKTKQVDNVINFRDKSLNYATLFDSAYKNAFKESLEILKSRNENKYTTFKDKVYPTIEILKHAEELLTKADLEMRNKYKIQLLDSSIIK